MSSGTLYEVHGCAKGQWRTIRTCGDAESAIAEAVRLRSTRRFSGIRVTEERYQNSSGQFVTRVVYRYAHRTRTPADYAQPSLSSSGLVARSSTSVAQLTRGVFQHGSETQAEFCDRLWFRLGLIVLPALGALYAIHWL